MLNIIWISFFLVSFLFGLIIGGNVWTDMVTAIFGSAKDAFVISINLTGLLCLWLGLLKVAEAAGLTQVLSKCLMPLFKRIMPEVPSSSPAIGSIVMNMAANMLGLDNAATPMGIKAMEQLQEMNKQKDTASNAEILFLVINSSAVTIIPITILMYRAELGAAAPSAVFLPILLATGCSTLVGFLSVAFMQKLKIFNKVVLAYLLGFVGLAAGIGLYFNHLPIEQRTEQAANMSNFFLVFIMVLFIAWGMFKKVNVYEKFIEGAKDGFEVAVKIIPYLVAMLVAIAALRASGVLDGIVAGFAWLFEQMGIDTGFVGALPTALLKPLSGSGARAMMIETMQTYGANSFAGFVASVVQGSTETTFYVLAVYFGAVQVSKTRHALPCALLADLAGIIGAVAFSYMFYEG